MDSKVDVKRLHLLALLSFQNLLSPVCSTLLTNLESTATDSPSSVSQYNHQQQQQDCQIQLHESSNLNEMATSDCDILRESLVGITLPTDCCTDPRILCDGQNRITRLYVVIPQRLTLVVSTNILPVGSIQQNQS
jgi:hypothetical protein